MMSKFNFANLSREELGDVLETIDGIHKIAHLMEERHVWTDDEELSFPELANAIVEELNTRARNSVGAPADAEWAL